MKDFPIINISTGFKNIAIGIIRISFGSLNKKILYLFFKKFFYKKIKPKIINFSYFYNIKNLILDKCLILYFNKPNSYTGEDVVEIHSHGNIFLLKNIIKNCILFLKNYNLRLSKKGEFSKRSLKNNKINIFDLKKIFILLNYKNLNLINNIDSFINKNLKNFILKLIKLINKIEIINELLLNFNNLKKKNILILINILKKKLYFFFNKNNIKVSKKKYFIIIGITNVGKSTFINNFLKNNFSIISSKKNTTIDNLKKKIYFYFNKFYFFDTPGLYKLLNIKEHLGLLFSLKNLKISDYVIYIFDNILFYNFYYYYIKKIIFKNQYLIKIINKIDFLKNYSFIENYISKNLKNIIINLSSKKKLGLFFFKINFKKNFFNILNNFDKIIFKIFKKSYKILNKMLFFYYNKNYLFFSYEIKKIKNFFYFIINKKKKIIINKIFKKFCIGK